MFHGQGLCQRKERNDENATSDANFTPGERIIFKSKISSIPSERRDDLRRCGGNGECKCLLWMTVTGYATRRVGRC